jgi:beta-glucanase (GH16 family)
LGNDYVDEKSWPYCGEIDIMESVGFEIDDETSNGKAHASIHCPAKYFKLNNQPTGIIDVENMENEFHNYTLEWSAEGMTAFVDDVPYFTYDDTTDEMTWPYDKAQNIIINLAMGGGWGGAQGMDESVTSQMLVIDYVRVYKRK